MTRDLTKKQFHRALERNGFAPTCGILPYYRDTTDQTDVHFGALLNDHGRIARRATIAFLISRRKFWIAKESAAAGG